MFAITTLIIRLLTGDFDHTPAALNPAALETWLSLAGLDVIRVVPHLGACLAGHGKAQVFTAGEKLNSDELSDIEDSFLVEEGRLQRRVIVRTPIASGRLGMGYILSQEGESLLCVLKGGKWAKSTCYPEPTPEPTPEPVPAKAEPKAKPVVKAVVALGAVVVAAVVPQGPSKASGRKEKKRIRAEEAKRLQTERKEEREEKKQKQEAKQKVKTQFDSFVEALDKDPTTGRTIMVGDRLYLRRIVVGIVEEGDQTQTVAKTLKLKNEIRKLESLNKGSYDKRALVRRQRAIKAKYRVLKHLAS